MKNELRIGNLVSITEQEKKNLFDWGEVVIKDNAFRVVLISEDELNLFIDQDGRSEELEFDYDEILPIPLTEEWFWKFDFYTDEMGYMNKSDSIYSFVDRGELGYMLVVADNEYKETYIKQVHSLQNLYFALTGEELK